MVTHRSRRAFVPILILMIAVVGSTVVWAQAPAMPASAVMAAAANRSAAGAETSISALHLLVGRSTVLDVGTQIARVSLTSPDVADALVTTPTQLLINGKTPGTISMFVWDRGGAIRRYEVIVQRDLVRLSEQLQELFPGEDIQVQPSGKDLVLSGAVSSKDAIEKAVNLAAGYVEKKEEVVSLLQLRPDAPSNQVLLHVRFAEVNRNALTELGASLFTGVNGYKNVVGRTTTQQFSAPFFDSKQGGLVFDDYLNLFLFDTKHQLGALFKALQSRGLFQSLAEPNLVAESGKEASFLAGGEIPVPIAQPNASGGVAVTIQYKEFGIRLNFTPVVNGNRIHLKVRPEVSSLDFANGIQIEGFKIPALSTRRAETELELENGQTFAIAGLMNNTMNKTLQKVPGIGDIPILGLLFRSEAAQKDRTELVVMITPEILPNNSNGVTRDLPRLQEPYLPPLPQNKSMEPPPPAFQGAPARRPGGAAPQGSAATESPSSAAAAVSALTPSAPQVSPEQAAQPGQAGEADKVDTSGVAVQPTTAPEPAVEPAGSATEAAGSAATPPAAAARPLTREEQKRLERARKLEQEQAAAEARARAEQQKQAAKQAEQDRKKAEKLAREQAKRDAEAAREKAKRDAEAAKRAQEEAKKQAEIEAEHQKEIAAAAERLHEAQLAYQAELAKNAKNKEKKP
ncbi:MAG: pilus assembly protein N-terminal domain-containing protein [Betaproteobacteria bacterium]